MEQLGYTGEQSSLRDEASAPAPAAKEEASLARLKESAAAGESAPGGVIRLGYRDGADAATDAEAGKKDAGLSLDTAVRESLGREATPFPSNRTLSLEDKQAAFNRPEAEWANGLQGEELDSLLATQVAERPQFQAFNTGGLGGATQAPDTETEAIGGFNPQADQTGSSAAWSSLRPGTNKRADSPAGDGSYRGPGDSVAARVSTRGAVPSNDAKARSELSERADGSLDLFIGDPAAESHLGAPSSPAAPPPSREELARGLSAAWDDKGQDDLDDAIAAGLLGEERKENVVLGLDQYGLADGASAGELDKRIDQWRANLSPEDRTRLAERCSEIVLSQCRRLPNEQPRDMYFRYWGDNPFELAQLDRLSTFAADVDTASYALARNYLNQGFLPEKAQVRTEEFVNYFAPDLAPPSEDVFAITTELAPSLFGGSAERWLLRVGIRAREVSREARKPLVLTFVVDTSGSMQEQGRLELVKHAMRLLVGELDARDKIGVVAFASDARLILPLTSAKERGLIESAIHPLQPEGSTNADAGLRMGYELALGGLDREAVNRVILLSDGVANTGQTDQDRITESVRAHREKGIYLNTIGVGMSNHNDVLLEQLADKGDGICDYVDSAASARHAIVDRFTGAFEPVASDVKIQVEFAPAQVYRWRQLGYENRVVADADFRNDAVDAGEIGAGHQVVALYELERMSGGPTEGPLAVVRLRWKTPKAPGDDPREIEVTEREAMLLSEQALGSYDATSYGYRRAVLVAEFAEFLRRSTHTENDRYSELMRACSVLAAEAPDGETAELASLVERAATLVLQAHMESTANRGELECAVSELRRLQIQRAEIESLQFEEARAMLATVRARSDALEAEIRELVRQRMQCEGDRESRSK